MQWADESVEGNGLISDVIAKVQESIDTYNLDSSACLQRAICFSVQSAGEKVGNHTAGGFESALDTIAR